MSPIVCTLWLFRRHLPNLWLFRDLIPWFTPMWYHAGSFFFRDFGSFSAAKLTCNFFPTWSICTISFGRAEPEWVLGDHVCRKVFIWDLLSTAPEAFVMC